MDKKYWEDIGKSYDEEIFDVLANDKKGVILKRLKKCASKKKTALDLGCGVGKFIPLLSDLFKKVIAVDISANCIANAKVLIKHVQYLRADMTRKNCSIPNADTVLSVNVIMMPDLAKREAAFDAAVKSVKKGGNLILVVPSLESALYSISRLIEWNLKEGLSTKRAVKADMPDITATNAQETKQGIIEIQGVPTKHYLKEELTAILESRGMSIKKVKKVKYGWDTEFYDPPDWLEKPYPWDWLIHAKA